MTPRNLASAAQYLRVSSDQQKHALVQQEAEIARYASANGLTIVNTYTDAGRSGLTLDNRPALRQLLIDVSSGGSDFGVLLVQDVSRLGRFQDIDEAGHYEFLFRLAGVSVRYCNEAFLNENSLTSGVFKTVKRLMAAEFSRELSSRVRRSQLHWVARGYAVGGMPGYGFRRAIVDDQDQPMQILGSGDRKFLADQRTLIVLGPSVEVDTIREIYRLYTEEDFSIAAIANILNERGSRATDGSLWNSTNVGRILSNQKYTGRFPFGRRRRALGGTAVRRPSDEWHHFELRVAPVITTEQFELARAKRYRRALAVSDYALLQELEVIIKKEGRLSVSAIGRHRVSTTPQTILRKFGSLPKIEAMFGIYPSSLGGDRERLWLEDDLARSRKGIWGPFRLFSGERQIAAGDDRFIISRFRRASDKGLGQLTVFDEASGRIILPKPRAEVFVRPSRQGASPQPPLSPLVSAFRVAAAFLRRRTNAENILERLSSADHRQIEMLEPKWGADVVSFIVELVGRRPQ